MDVMCLYIRERAKPALLMSLYTEACNMHVYNMMEKRSQLFKQRWRVDVLRMSVVKLVPFKAVLLSCMAL